MTSSLAIRSFQAVADEISSLVFSAYSDGDAVNFTRKLQDFTGLAEVALLGGAWLLAVHDDDRASAQSAWKQAIATQ
jgi:hypothetical protein